VRETLGTFAEKYKEELETLLVCAGNRQEIVEFAANLADAVRIVPDPRNDLLAQFRVANTPFVSRPT
jgi:hypothetical protein